MTVITSAIVLAVLNVLFLSTVFLAYVAVHRRRSKLYFMVEHLAALAQRAMPLQTGLRMVGQDLGGLMSVRLARVARRLEEGKTLGQAFEEVPRVAPPFVRTLVALGEKGGNLGAFLAEARLAVRSNAELEDKSSFAFLYPVLLTGFISLMLSAMFAVTFPRMEAVLDQLGHGELFAPWWPRLVAANEALIVLCGALIVLALTGGIRLSRRNGRARLLKRLVDGLLLRMPFSGGVLRDRALATFSRGCGLILRAGGTLPEAVRACADTEWNETWRRRFDRLAASTADGAPLSAAVRGDGGFPDEFVWYVETGEGDGALSEHLLQAAAHYDTRTRYGAQMALRSLIPLFVALNGMIVLGAMLLMFGSIFYIQGSMIPS